MKTQLFGKPLCLIFYSLIFFGQSLNATKLVEVRPVDKDYLMVCFKDGEVWYRDDGTGESAYTGHDFAEGDDRLIAFGDSLDGTLAGQQSVWRLSSVDDPEYGPDGLNPVAVYRKSKVNHTDHNWKYKLDHWIFLKLPGSLKQGFSYTLTVDAKTGTDRTAVDFTWDMFSSVSEAVHVNLIGYTPWSQVKSADLYLWLGDGGARDFCGFEGNTVWLLDVKTGKKQKTGKVSFWKKSATEAEGRNLTGSDVWNADFDRFKKSGTYRLVIENVGCSPEFEIRPDVYSEPFKYSVRGYYYMRVGEDRMDMNPVPRRPLFIPGKDPEGFTVYVTDLDPFDPLWRKHRGDTWDECHFKPAEESMFWKRRLPGNPTNPNAFGGHSDALDWDRHLAHVSNIYDLLLPYFLSAGDLDEDNLDIGESGNGIPDLIDEARDEVDFFLRLRHDGGYAQGLTNPTRERTMMFQAGNTTMAAWANAANCAMIADCFRISGHRDLMIHYRDESKKAFTYAEIQENQQLDDRQEIGDGAMRGRDFKMMAAAFLYNVTGEQTWEEIAAAESVVVDTVAWIENGRDWVQTWATAALLFSPHKMHFPRMIRNMKTAIRFQAFENNVRFMEIRPSRRASNKNWWQTAHNLHMVILAHAVSKDKAELIRLERAMILEADWGLGRNPSNIVEMTGLGSRHIVNCYTSGRNDGSPGLHPGQTPYNNLGDWGKSPNGSNPAWFTERGYPDWEDGGWPHQEAHFNCRYSWANGEFTPRQTMRGKMALYGYLVALGKKH